jgi:hypothetical protein
MSHLHVTCRRRVSNAPQTELLENESAAEPQRSQTVTESTTERKGAKRQLSGQPDKSPSAKRRKKSEELPPTPRKKAAVKDVESESEDDVRDAKMKKTAARRQLRQVVEDSEDENSSPEVTIVELDDGDVNDHLDGKNRPKNDGQKSRAKKKAEKSSNGEKSGSKPRKDEKSSKAKKRATEESAEDGARPSEEEEYSDVIDEPPKPKRKKKDIAAVPSTKTKKTPIANSIGPLDSLEAEIKKLEQQLVKCGVRKIWAIELKKYGDDSRAKISHLKGLLKDIGMEGRFSEARAREIKEARELASELAEVTTMNEYWGVGSGRGAKNQAEDGDDGSNDGQSDVGAYAKSRGTRKAHADLAFLGDDSEESN